MLYVLLLNKICYQRLMTYGLVQDVHHVTVVDYQVGDDSRKMTIFESAYEV